MIAPDRKKRKNGREGERIFGQLTVENLPRTEETQKRLDPTNPRGSNHP